MQTLKIGTRGSKLALIQTEMVIDHLKQAHPGIEVEIVEIQTSGEWKPAQGETRLSEVDGGKGLFAKEIEQALLDGHIDCGVHSMKDMASFLPDGLVIDHFLPREDPRDAFLSNEYDSIQDLPAGAVIGTSSVRRQSFLYANKDDIKVVPLRGNVPTRIEKLRSGQADAIILALSGLIRLGLEDEVSSILEPSEMLPAAGQGAVGIETRESDDKTRSLFDAIHCNETGLCVKAERAALAVLDGSCHTPIGAYAKIDNNVLSLEVCVCSEDGKVKESESVSGTVHLNAEAHALGNSAGTTLKERIDPSLLT